MPEKVAVSKKLNNSKQSPDSFDPFTTPCVRKAQAAVFCRVSVDAVETAAKRLGITMHPTVAGGWLLCTRDVRLLVEHFAARPR